MHHFETPTPPRLTIELGAGTITITTADVDETTVDLQPRHDSKAARDAVAATTIEQRDGEIVVIVPKRLGSIIGRSSALTLTVTAPHGTALVITTGSAEVVATGRYAATTVTSGSGAIDVDEVTDSARLRSGSGRIRVATAARDLNVANGSGDVEIGTVSGSASVHTGSGDIRVTNAGEAVEVKSGSGDVSIGTAPAAARIRTASGDIAIETVARGEVWAKAASGDIRAGVRTGTAARLDVRTISGRVSSDLESSPAPEADEQRAHLQLETVSGDIELIRV